MHVDVHQSRITQDRQGQDRVAVGTHRIGIGPPHGAEQQSVPDWPAIDGEVDLARGAPMEARQTDVTRKGEAFAGHVEGQRVPTELGTEHAGQPSENRRRTRLCLSRENQRRPTLGSQDQPDLGLSNREPTQDISDRRRFGPVGLEEFQARRSSREQIGHLHARAARARGWADLALVARIHRERDTGLGRGRPTGQGQARDRPDGG
jgi:hypothetical protein